MLFPQAIQNPGDLRLQERAWSAVCPLVAKLKRFYEFSLRLGEHPESPFPPSLYSPAASRIRPLMQERGRFGGEPWPWGVLRCGCCAAPCLSFPSRGWGGAQEQEGDQRCFVPRERPAEPAGGPHQPPIRSDPAP